jgi:hypothetical protein
MRHTTLTTQQAIEILANDGSIYWTEDGYENVNQIDWNAVSVFFNTEEIHTFCNGLVTRIYLPSSIESACRGIAEELKGRSPIEFMKKVLN